ncbi:MAG: hypothetical protein ACLQDC_13965 [Verrucomicrobiia bacterium]
MKRDCLVITAIIMLATAARAANVAFDSAADPAYSGGWSSTNGGYGFTAWTLVPLPCASNGYFYVNDAVNGCNHTAPGIDTSGVAWGMSSDTNSLFCSTNDVPQVGAVAYRGFTGGRLSVGQTFEIYVQHGSVDGGLGIEFRTSTDMSSHSGGERLNLYRSPNTDWLIWDQAAAMTNGAVDTGMPWDTAGYKVDFTLTGVDTYSLTISNLDPSTSVASVTTTGTLNGASGAGLDSVALFTESPFSYCYQNLYWNSMSVTGPAQPNIANEASDSAADVAYTNSYPNTWATGLNGGYGFSPWTMYVLAGDGYFYANDCTQGCCGVSNPRTLPGIDTTGPNGPQAWGISADTNTVAAPSQAQVFATRGFNGGSLAVGQLFEMQVQNSYVDGGAVGIDFRTGNSQSAYNSGERLSLYFNGSPHIYDGHANPSLLGYDTGGFQVDFNLISVDTYSLTLSNLSSGASTNVTGTLSGTAGSGIDSIAVYNLQNLSDAWHNFYANRLRVTSTVAPVIKSAKLFQATNAVISFQSISNAVYFLQRAPDMSGTNWSTVLTNVTGNGGMLDLTNSLPGPTQKQFYRVGKSY